MTRAVFVTAPFKARMMEKMTNHFSSRLEATILIPSFPYAPESRQGPFTRRIRTQLLGDEVLNQELLDLSPDLIYSDSPFHAAAVKLFLQLNHKSIPFIIHLRGDWWREYGSWFTAATWRKRLLSLQQYSYNWSSLLTATKITPICRWLEQVVKAHLPTKSTEVVYQGVDPAEFSGKPVNLGFRGPSVALIQNHTTYQKVEGLLMFKGVIQRLANVNFYIAEGEDYTQSYFPLVKRSLQQLRNVHFVGGVDSPSAVRNMLGSADVYVLASGLDCCPTTVLEASLMHKPVLASRVGGVPEIILENQSGWTIPNNHTDEWVHKLSHLLKDDATMRKFGAAGSKWVRKSFAWSVIAGRVEELICEHAGG